MSDHSIIESLPPSRAGEGADSAAVGLPEANAVSRRHLLAVAAAAVAGRLAPMESGLRTQSAITPAPRAQVPRRLTAIDPSAAGGASPDIAFMRTLQADATTGLSLRTTDTSGALSIQAGRPVNATYVAALERVTWGWTPDMPNLRRRNQWNSWVDEQLDPTVGETPTVVAATTQMPTLSMSIPERYAVSRQSGGAFRLRSELTYQLACQAVHSTRQVRARVERSIQNLVWTSISDPTVLWCKADEIRALRAHTLGRYADVLVASAESSAMLVYLDNWLSMRSSPNENYGRELLELHTVGLGNFDEDDVKAVARVFTGWTIQWWGSLEFWFEPSIHDGDDVDVLGWSRAGLVGVDAGRDLLEHLARQPSTARRVARHLCQSFVSADPPESLVASAAAAYLAHDTSIAETVRHILRSDAFWAALDVPMMRTPMEHLVAVYRAGGGAVRTDGDVDHRRATSDYMTWWLVAMGEPPFDHPVPTGYPQDPAYWSSAGMVLDRHQWMATFAYQDRDQPFGIDVSAVLQGPVTTRALIRRAFEKFLHRSSTSAEEAFFQRFVGVGLDAEVSPYVLATRGYGLLGAVFAHPDMHRR